jgi:hypothetical protein
METYFKGKLVNFDPMTKREYNAVRGLEPDENDNQDRDGVLIEYLDGSATNHPQFFGYIDWVTEQEFEAQAEFKVNAE